MSAEDIEFISKLGIIGISLIAFGMWVARNNRNHKLFDAFAKKTGLKNVSGTGSFFFPSTPHLKGGLQGYQVNLVIQRKKGKWFGRWKYYTIIRVNSRVNLKCEYSVTQTNLVDSLASVVMVHDIVTGYPEFDVMYNLRGNNDAIVLKIFDQHTCVDFVSNPDAFRYSGFTFTNGIMEFCENRMVINQAQMNRIGEILLFMIHLVERSEKVVGAGRKLSN